jgi:hypothetical protein
MVLFVMRWCWLRKPLTQRKCCEGYYTAGMGSDTVMPGPERKPRLGKDNSAII